MTKDIKIGLGVLGLVIIAGLIIWLVVGGGDDEPDQPAQTEPAQISSDQTPEPKADPEPDQGTSTPAPDDDPADTGDGSTNIIKSLIERYQLDNWADQDYSSENLQQGIERLNQLTAEMTTVLPTINCQQFNLNDLVIEGNFLEWYQNAPEDSFTPEEDNQTTMVILQLIEIASQTAGRCQIDISEIPTELIQLLPVSSPTNT